MPGEPKKLRDAYGKASKTDKARILDEVQVSVAMKKYPLLAM